MRRGDFDEGLFESERVSVPVFETQKSRERIERDKTENENIIDRKS